MRENGMITLARRLGDIRKASWETHVSVFLVPFQSHPCAAKVKSTEKVGFSGLLASGHLGMGPLTTIPVPHPV